MMKYLVSPLALLGLMISAQAQTVTLSNVSVITGPANAGTLIGTVTITNAASGRIKKMFLSLGGGDAAKFRLSSAKSPSVLSIGSASLPNGQYHITVVVE